MFELVLPASWHYGKTVPQAAWYPWWFAWALVWCGVFGLLYVLAEPLRIRARQWRLFVRYPPLWSAVLAAFVLAGASEYLPLPLRPQQGGPDWQTFGVVGPIALAVALAFALRQFATSRRQSANTPTTIPDTIEWSTLQRWMAVEQPVLSGEPDFFGHKPLADRINQSLLEPKNDQAVALLGAYGSGKTSILNWVRESLRNSSDPIVIVAEFNAWAMSRPEDAPRVALEQIVSALDETS